MLSIRRILVATSLMTLLVAPFVACSSDEECIGGKQCTCEGDSCDFDCADGGDCQYTCDAGQDCSGSCPEGGCQMTCKGSDSCVLDCPGGGCQLTCLPGTPRCEITGCHASCQLTCNGAASCQSSCSPLDGGCQTQP
jgi:hypothetical protein